MKQQLKIFTVALSLVLIFSFLVTGVAYAITIVVDGVKEAAWDGQNGQTPGNAFDVDEPAISNDKDIKYVYWTNDSTYMYFMIETWGTTSLAGNPQPTIVICLDTDDNQATGGSYLNCNDMHGVDRSIVFTRSYFEVYSGDPNSGTLLSTPDAQRATAGAITELRVSLASLGLNTTVCNNQIKGAVYFDNGTTEPDDNTPDDGRIALHCGTPTAVKTAGFSGRALPSWPWLAGGFSAAVLACLAGAFFFLRRK